MKELTLVMQQLEDPSTPSSFQIQDLRKGHLNRGMLQLLNKVA